MKKVFFVILFLTFIVKVKAQEEIYKTVAAETCECFEKRKAELTNKKEAEMALGVCMIGSAQTNKVDIDLTDEDAMRAFGEKVGVQMVLICPDVFNMLVGDTNEENEETTRLVGKIKSVEIEEFLFATLKEDSGKEHKLLWIRYFPGSDDYKDNPRKLVGKKVTVVYESIECYFPKMKAYYTSKEIKELKVND